MKTGDKCTGPARCYTEYNSLHNRTLQRTTAIGSFEKAHNSLNVTHLGFVVLSVAGPQHQPQVAGEARPARQWIHGGAGRTVAPRPHPTSAPLTDAQRLVAEDGDELVARGARLVRETPEGCQGPERTVQPGAVFGRGLEVGYVFAECLRHF